VKRKVSPKGGGPDRLGVVEAVCRRKGFMRQMFKSSNMSWERNQNGRRDSRGRNWLVSGWVVLSKRYDCRWLGKIGKKFYWGGWAHNATISVEQTNDLLGGEGLLKGG